MLTARLLAGRSQQVISAKYTTHLNMTQVVRLNPLPSHTYPFGYYEGMI
jgi:hypothetical protein